MANIFPAISDSGATTARRMQVYSGASMRIIIQALASLAILLSTLSSASAETLEAKANAVNQVGFFYFYGSRAYGCHTLGKGVVRVNRQPEHGAIRTEWRKLPMTNARGCKGTVGQGLAVWYTPHKGYRGTDKFSFTMSVPGLAPGASYGGSKHWNIKVNVK
jgi:hypothetical protein